MNKEIFFHGGTLLTSEQQQKLNEFYGESRAQWQLIYKATKDGFDAKDFHRQCDGKGPTMTIIQSTRGYIFGGYTAVPWSSNFGSRLDSTAFLFTLENPHDIPMTMFNIDTRKSKYAVIHHGYCGPIFGVNNNIDACDYELNYDPRYADLCVWGGSNSMDSYTNFPNFFIDTVGCANKTFTGNNRFRCMDIELYVLTDN